MDLPAVTLQARSQSSRTSTGAITCHCREPDVAADSTVRPLSAPPGARTPRPPSPRTPRAPASPRDFSMTLRAPEDRNAILDRRLAWNDESGSAVLLSLVQTLAPRQRVATARPASARVARRAPSPPRFSPRRPRSARPAAASAAAAVARTSRRGRAAPDFAGGGAQRGRGAA